MAKMKELLYDLASEIVEFAKDYDIYEFNDEFEDDDIAFDSTMVALVRDTNSVIRYLEDIAERESYEYYSLYGEKAKELLGKVRMYATGQY